MKCEVCGVGERRPQLIRHTFFEKERLIVVDHIPASVCGHCGETSFSPDVVERVQKSVWNADHPDRLLQAEVYEFV